MEHVVYSLPVTNTFGMLRAGRSGAGWRALEKPSKTGDCEESRLE